MDRVRWTRPQQAAAAAEVAPARPSFDPNTFSRPFEITNPSGDKPAWTPTHVYENSGKTFIEFPPKMGPMTTAPALYKAGGGDIPFRITGGRFYEVDTSITDAELRLDSSVVRIKRLG